MGAGLVLEGGRWMTQEEMIEAMGDGDMEAFHLFYQDTARPVYSFILSLTKDPHEAEDLMQDTFLAVWDSASSYENQGKPLAWVFTIARHLCYMRFRQRKRETDLEGMEQEKREEGQVSLVLEQAADRRFFWMHWMP